MRGGYIGKFRWMWRTKPCTFPKHTPDGLAWPKLTVITPSFNQGRFLEETIRSVLYQGYPNLEYIVIDGGSSDGSVEIIRRYQDRLAFWVSEKDGGQSNAINKGLSRATGEIVGWINSDDVYTKRSFHAVMSYFAREPEVGLVYGGRILLDENSTVSGWSPGVAFDPESTGYNICSETAFWRRQPDDPRLKEDLKFAMDLEFFLRISQTRRSVRLDRFLGCFRCYPDNKSSTMWDVCIREARAEWEALYGEGHTGWMNKQRVSLTRMILSFAANPASVAFPYLCRRFILGRRGF